jgi:ubiquinone/menaquinone biosynthesis C-methylase UbiE
MTMHDVNADLSKLIMGFRVSQAIHVAATLGLADLLASGPKTSNDLAAATDTHPLALYRLMRALSSAGIFCERDHRRFELTPVAELLRSNAAGTHAPMAQLVGRPSSWQAWGDLLYAVRTGNTAFDHVHGRGVWEHRAQHPAEGEVFDRAMSTRTEQFAEAALAACDFSRFAHVVDVGGGEGTFLAAILTAHPRTRGTLFDQPQTIARAQSSLASLGLSTRCQAVGGNFFASVPDGGDAYLLKWILHDWDDTASVDILRACRRAMKPSGALIVLERLVGAANTASEAKFADLHMLVMNGGRERTRDEFASLLGESGFRLVSVTPTSTPLFVIEGVPKMPE